jgi:putative transposase
MVMKLDLRSGLRSLCDLMRHGLSRRRACALLSVSHSTIGYLSRLVARDAPVLAPLRTLTSQYLRYGYRTIRIFLERQGDTLGTDRLYRLWRQERLQVPKRRPRRPLAMSRPRPLPPTGIKSPVAYDFVFDTCADDRTLKCLTIIDEFTRQCLAIDVAGSIRSARVLEVLTQLVSVHGAPRYLRPITDPSSSRAPSFAGYRRRRSRRRSSTRASGGRTAPTNRSTASSATSICRSVVSESHRRESGIEQ